jgi:hypothetical protein
MEDYKKHLRLLGLKVKDRVTGYEGVVSSVSFDLYGCMQALLMPEFQGKETPDSRWFDANRLEVICDTPVMDPPNFISEIIATKGGEILPPKY